MRRRIGRRTRSIVEDAAAGCWFALLSIDAICRIHLPRPLFFPPLSSFVTHSLFSFLSFSLFLFSICLYGVGGWVASCLSPAFYRILILSFTSLNKTFYTSQIQSCPMPLCSQTAAVKINQIRPKRNTAIGEWTVATLSRFWELCVRDVTRLIDTELEWKWWSLGRLFCRLPPLFLTHTLTHREWRPIFIGRDCYRYLTTSGCQCLAIGCRVALRVPSYSQHAATFSIVGFFATINAVAVKNKAKKKTTK